MMIPFEVGEWKFTKEEILRLRDELILMRETCLGNGLATTASTLSRSAAILTYMVQEMGNGPNA